jgi:hypothetical protein
LVNLVEQEAEELQKEMKALECERAALVRDVKLKDEMEKQYATRSTLQVSGSCAASTIRGHMEGHASTELFVACQAGGKAGWNLASKHTAAIATHQQQLD